MATYNRVIIVFLGLIGLISLIGSFVLIALGKPVALEVIAPVGAAMTALAAIANSTHVADTKKKPGVGDTAPAEP